MGAIPIPSIMKTIKTHIPQFHFEPRMMMSWQVDHDVIHFKMEDAFDVEELDLRLVVGLTDDGMPSVDEDDIIEAIAESVYGHEYEVYPYKAIRFLKNDLIPYINENFPKPIS
jgi:hypothetical protein